MPVWRMQVEFGADSALPKDSLVITPHFNDTGAGTDPDGLAQDLADGLTAVSDAARQIKVTAYDAQGTPPVFPQAQAIANAGSFPPSQVPREIALCFSFYSEQNRPRYRGRLYLPWVLKGGQSPGLRPSMTTANTLGSTLASLFSGLGGADVDWVVYSRVDDEARKVSNWWIDDEWDTVRSRGLRPTTRATGSTSG
jgi:hypothetical protein